MGETVTVTVGAFVETQPFALVTVSVYVVVATGAAIVLQLAGLDRPVEGLHEQLVPPEPKSGVSCPRQIVVVPEATAKGGVQTPVSVTLEILCIPVASVAVSSNSYRSAASGTNVGDWPLRDEREAFESAGWRISRQFQDVAVFGTEPN
jgi:hypothetical protein